MQGSAFLLGYFGDVEVEHVRGIACPVPNLVDDTPVVVCSVERGRLDCWLFENKPVVERCRSDPVRSRSVNCKGLCGLGRRVLQPLRGLLKRGVGRYGFEVRIGLVFLYVDRFEE